LWRKALCKDGVKIHIVKKPWWRRKKHFVRTVTFGGSLTVPSTLPTATVAGEVSRYGFAYKDGVWAVYDAS
jgi:hypothetical protein